jgi:hypothetical protein
MAKKKQETQRICEIKQTAELELIQKEWYKRVVTVIDASISLGAVISELINDLEVVPHACQITTNSGDKYSLLFGVPSYFGSPELDAIEEIEDWKESEKLRLEQEIRLNAIKKQAIAKLTEEERKALGL